MPNASEIIQNFGNMPKLKSLGARLGYAIISLGYKDSIDFGRDFGVKRSTLYSIINDQTKSPGTKILEACRKAGINVDWLLTGEGEALLPEKNAIKEEAGHNEPTAGGELAKEAEHLMRRIGSKPMRSQNKDGVVVFEREQAIAAIINSLKLLDVSELQRIVERATGILEERQRAEQDTPRKTNSL